MLKFLFAELDKRQIKKINNRCQLDGTLKLLLMLHFTLMNLMLMRVINVSTIEEKPTLPAIAGCVFFVNVASFISHMNHQLDESILLFK